MSIKNKITKTEVTIVKNFYKLVFIYHFAFKIYLISEKFLNFLNFQILSLFRFICVFYYLDNCIELPNRRFNNKIFQQKTPYRNHLLGAPLV